MKKKVKNKDIIREQNENIMRMVIMGSKSIKYRSLAIKFGILSLLLLMFIASYFIMKVSVKNEDIDIAQKDSMNIVLIDSLKNEIFIEKCNVQRYETAMDRIQSEDSTFYIKFEKYLRETE